MRPLLLAALVPLLPLRVVDGDTFDGRLTLRPGLTEDRRVRLHCADGRRYDAPEVRADGGGVAAKQHLAAWLSRDGGYVLVTDWGLDSFGRVLGEPFRGGAGYCAEVPHG